METKLNQHHQVPFTKSHRLKLDIEIFFEKIMRKINNHIHCKLCDCEKSWHVWNTGYGFSIHGLCVNPDCEKAHLDCYYNKKLEVRKAEEKLA